MAATALFPAIWVALVALPGSRPPRVRVTAAWIGALCVLATPWLGFWRYGRFAQGLVQEAPLSTSTLWFLASIALLVAWAILARSLWSRPRNRLLVAWLGLAVLGSLAGSHFPAVRYINPVLVPLALLVTLDLADRFPGSTRAGLVCLAAAGNLWLSLSLVRSDTLFAEFLRRSAAEGTREARALGLPLVTTGSWGLRYYVEQAGGTVLGSATDPLPKGALLLEPTYTDRRVTPAGLRARTQRISVRMAPAPPWIPLLPARTIPPPATSASFYGGHYWLPYAFSAGPLEIIEFREIQGHI